MPSSPGLSPLFMDYLLMKDLSISHPCSIFVWSTAFVASSGSLDGSDNILVDVLSDVRALVTAANIQVLEM